MRSLLVSITFVSVLGLSLGVPTYEPRGSSDDKPEEQLDIDNVIAPKTQMPESAVVGTAESLADAESELKKRAEQRSAKMEQLRLDLAEPAVTPYPGLALKALHQSVHDAHLHLLHVLKEAMPSDETRQGEADAQSINPVYDFLYDLLSNVTTPQGSDASTMSASTQKAPTKGAMITREALHRFSKISDGAKAVVQLGTTMKHLQNRLVLGMDKLAPEEQWDAATLLGHVKPLATYGRRVKADLKSFGKIKDGNKADKQASIAALFSHMRSIKDGVQRHEAAMRTPGPSPQLRTRKLASLVKAMRAKVAAELADPATRDAPRTLLDYSLFVAVNRTVGEMERLMLSGVKALATAPVAQVGDSIRVAVQVGAARLRSELQSELAVYKERLGALANASAGPETDAAAPLPAPAMLVG